MSVIEKPIIFSGPMVRAILRGEKTQTRRIIFGASASANDCSRDCFDSYGYHSVSDHEIIRVPWTERVIAAYMKCPHPVSTRLWVRETWIPVQYGSYEVINGPISRIDRAYTCPLYAADPASGYHQPYDDYVGKWRTSMFMPRWASRITLEVTDVRVQRVQDISEEDARAEGIADLPTYASYSMRDKFQALWNDINAKRGYSWQSNPWVWAYTFRRVQESA